MSASSEDGLAWTPDGRVLLDHASVPAAISLPDGRIRLYYVDASNVPENVNCADSADRGETFIVLGCHIENLGGDKAVDPSIVRLDDGTFRLFYYAVRGRLDSPGRHAISWASSEDGITFRGQGEAYEDEGLVDPDVFWSGRDWLMYVFSLSKPGTTIAKSDDGVSFSYLGMLHLQGWGTTAPIRLDERTMRLYAFEQRTQTEFHSFTSTNGIDWLQEPGVRLQAPLGKEITDPFVVRLPDGAWKMFFKVSPRPR
jgi:hypothetical protein